MNAELFDWHYTHQQVSGLTLDSIGNLVFATVNAGTSDSKGAEVNIAFRATPTTQFDGDEQYLDSSYTNFVFPAFLPPNPSSACTGSGAFFSPAGGRINCSGLPLLGASKWTINLGVDQTVPLPTAIGSWRGLVAGIAAARISLSIISRSIISRVTPREMRRSGIIRRAINGRWS